jgi:predicted HTH domain antitoxin
MKVLTLNIPETVNLDEKEARTMLAANLYAKGRLSLGQGAELAGYSKKTFMELLSDFGVSIFDYTATELENDILNAKAYHI